MSVVSHCACVPRFITSPRRTVFGVFCARLRPTSEPKLTEDSPASANACLFSALRCCGPVRRFVGNLPFSVSEDDVAALFQGLQVSNVKLVRDFETDRFRGFGYVEFSSPEDAQQALQRHGMVRGHWHIAFA